MATPWWLPLIAPLVLQSLLLTWNPSFLCGAILVHPGPRLLVNWPPPPHSLFPPPNGSPNSIVRPSKTTSRHRLHLVRNNSIINNFSTTLDVPAVSLPRHNSSAQLPSKLPAELFSAPPPHLGPSWWRHPTSPAVLRRPLCRLVPQTPLLTIRIRSRHKVIAVSSLKACTAADAKPGSLCHLGRPPGSHPGGTPTTKQVSFSDLLASSPSFLVPPRDGPGTVFLPGEEVFACLRPAVLYSLHRRDTRPVNGHRHRG